MLCILLCYFGTCKGRTLFAGGDTLCTALKIGFCLLKVLEVMRCMLISVLEAVGVRLCLLEVLEMPEVICCALLCMLEVVDSGSVSRFHWCKFRKHQART